MRLRIYIYIVYCRFAYLLRLGCLTQNLFLLSFYFLYVFCSVPKEGNHHEDEPSTISVVSQNNHVAHEKIPVHVLLDADVAANNPLALGELDVTGRACLTGEFAQ